MIQKMFRTLNIDIDVMAAETSRMSTLERGQWFEGFLAGANGESRDKGWSEPKQFGHAFGALAFWSENFDESL